MSIINKDGIGIGIVDTILYDSGGLHNIIVVVDESHDDFLKFLGFHLSMTNSHTSIWHILMDEVGNLGQVANTAIDKIHLSVSTHLEVDGIGDNFVVVSS